MNTAHLEIDVETVTLPQDPYQTYGDRVIIRDSRHEMIFIMTYRENNRRIWRRTWKAFLRSSDFDDDERLIRIISTHLKERPDVEIWAMWEKPDESEEWQPIVEITNRAQQIFSFLRNPGQKWLTEFAK